MIGGSISFISTNDELQVMIEFPDMPFNRPYFTEWRIKYRTPDDTAWQYERRLIKDLVGNKSVVMNFSSPGSYEFEVSAVDKEEAITSVPLARSFCKYHSVWGPVVQWLVQRFRSERLRVRSRRSATFTPSAHVRRQSLPVWPPTLNNYLYLYLFYSVCVLKRFRLDLAHGREIIRT